MFSKIQAFFSKERHEARCISFHQKVQNFLKFILSLFTDIDWDGDSAKVFGFGILILGAFGFWYEKQGFEIVMTIGGGMIASGKWSKQG